MSHSNVAPGTCFSCHNGTSASGKITTHISTTKPCDTCHLTTAWKPATMDHSNVVKGTCATCHNGTSTWQGFVAYFHHGVVRYLSP
jgi:hypothetical protein